MLVDAYACVDLGSSIHQDAGLGVAFIISPLCHRIHGSRQQAFGLIAVVLSKSSSTECMYHEATISLAEL